SSSSCTWPTCWRSSAAGVTSRRKSQQTLESWPFVCYAVEELSGQGSPTDHLTTCTSAPPRFSLAGLRRPGPGVRSCPETGPAPRGRPMSGHATEHQLIHTERATENGFRRGGALNGQITILGTFPSVEAAKQHAERPRRKGVRLIWQQVTEGGLEMQRCGR